jgi:phosphoglycolate phosphatase (TIGR01487 family)
MIRAVACDIDGTITDEKRRLNTEAIRLLRKIEEMGIPVVLATGNILCRTEAASGFIGTTGPLIAENGGILKDRKSGKTLYFCNNKKGELKRALEHLSNLMPVREIRRSELRKTEIAIYPDYDPMLVKQALTDFNVNVVFTKFAIHITHPQINKGSALSEVAKNMGLEVDDFAAIGDSENDYEMLQIAGLGISVGEEGLEEVAQIITKERFGKGGIEALNLVINKIK